MFTGIITGVGQIVDSQPLGEGPGHGRRLTLQTPAGYLDGVGLGDSIAINGACMTVTSFDVAAGRFTIDVSAESLARTAGLDTLGPVNLEQALRSHDRLGGHIVIACPGLAPEPRTASHYTWRSRLRGRDEAGSLRWHGAVPLSIPQFLKEPYQKPQNQELTQLFAWTMGQAGA